MSALTGWKVCFLFFLLAVLGLYLVGELTHMRSMCVGVAETGVEHCSPAKILKETFLLLALLNDQKRGKSQQGGLTPSSFQTTGGVHELVARAVRGECVRQMAKQKSVVLPLSASHTTTRADTAHEKTEQIRARIVCTPAYKGGN